MATNSNNLEPEFDALLKAHVKQSASVEVCHQFDPDDATAYLERALSDAALTRFESHLSACSVCRRHLIELSRLMPSQPTMTPTVLVKESWQDRWRDWFSGWRLGALAGLGAVAATVLVVTTLITTSSPENTSLVATTKQASAEASPLPQISPGTDLRPISEPQGAPKNTIVPSPSVTVLAPVASAPASSIVNEPNAAALEATPPPPPPPAPAPTSADTVRKDAPVLLPAAGAGAPQNQTNNFHGQIPNGPENNQLQAERSLEMRKREAVPTPLADTAAAASARPAAKPTEQAEEKVVEKSRRESADDADRKQDKAKPAMPARKSTNLARTPRPGRTIGGKTFLQENGVWIDIDYAANQNLPVVRLTRDSDVYQQTLKDTPALKPFFDLKPVIVVWQGKVYRVENK